MQSEKSVYSKKLGLQGDATITLSADERMIICEALAKAAPHEVDILPLLTLADRLTKGGDCNEDGSRDFSRN